MNEITIFKNERFGEVRTATSESGEPLFAAVDVAHWDTRILEMRLVSIASE
jgi:prophage antirepressor-like protein